MAMPKPAAPPSVAAVDCAGCARPLIWLDGSPFDDDDLARCAIRCDDCLRWMHSDCFTEGQHQDTGEFDGRWLCLACWRKQ
jgi:hypothetical protein